MDILKRHRYPLFVLIISLLPLIPTFINADMIHTHDGLVHLARLAEYYKDLSDGQIIPRWAGNLNYGYGTPLFIFIYHVPYLIGSIFLKFGATLILAFKLTLTLSYFLSGIFMYLYAINLTGSKKIAIFITVLYQYSPFRFAEMFIRGSIGESYTYTFLPLILYGIHKMIESTKYRYAVLTALSTSLLILSHNGISLVFFIIAFMYVFIITSDNKKKIIILSALAAGLGLSAFFWLPAIIEHKYTYGDLFMKDMYLTHFVSLFKFIIPNPLFNEGGAVGGVPVQVGSFHFMGIILGIFVLFRKIFMKIKQTNITLLSAREIKDYLMIIGFALSISIASLILMTPVSKFLWQTIPLLRQFQFPWRFLAPIGFATALTGLSFFAFRVMNKPIYYWGILLLTIFSTVYYWFPPLGFKPINVSYYWNYPLNSTYFGEADVVWSAGPAASYPKNPIETQDGIGKITKYSKHTNYHTYTINTPQDTLIIDHTVYFPGWRVYVDGKKTPVEFQNQQYRGLLTYRIEKGTHVVKAIFEESKIRLIGDILSILSLIMLIPSSIIWKKIYV